MQKSLVCPNFAVGTARGFETEKGETENEDKKETEVMWKNRVLLPKRSKKEKKGKQKAPVPKFLDNSPILARKVNVAAPVLYPTWRTEEMEKKKKEEEK